MRAKLIYLMEFNGAKKLRISLHWTLFLIGMSQVVFASPRIEYADYGIMPDHNSPPISFLVIDQEKKLVGINDNVGTADFCNDKELFCITSDQFIFSVPRYGVKSNQKWNWHGIEFAASDIQQIRLLGASIGIFRIDAKQENILKYTYYYNNAHGLMAIIFPLNYHGAASVYWCESAVCFGRPVR